MGKQCRSTTAQACPFIPNIFLAQELSACIDHVVDHTLAYACILHSANL